MPKAIVIATPNVKLNKINAFLFFDKKANKSFLTNSEISPWSPYTGLASVRKDHERRVYSSQQIKEKLHKLTACPTCSVNIMVNKVAASDASFKKHMFCPVCATDLHNVDLTNTDDMTLIPETEDEATHSAYPQLGGDNEVTEPALHSIDDFSTFNGDDEGSAESMLPVNRRRMTPIAKSTKDLKKEKKLDKKARKEKKAKKAAKQDDATLMNRKAPPKINDATPPETITIPKDVTYQAVTGEPVTASIKSKKIVVDFSNVNLTKADLAVVPVTANQCYLFANEIPVMVLKSERADAAIVPLFANATKMLEAIDNTIATNSFDPAKFGAKRIKAKLQLDKTLASQIKAKEKELKTTFAAREASLENDYFTALSVAALAVNKNTVDKYPNTLKAALIKSLKDCGVRNPERLVDNCFSSESENFLRNVVGYAKEFKNKSKAAQKEISKFVSSASYNTVVATDTSNDVADHLDDANVGLELASLISREPKTTTQPQTLTASSNSSDVEYYANLLRRR